MCFCAQSNLWQCYQKDDVAIVVPVTPSVVSSKTGVFLFSNLCLPLRENPNITYLSIITLEIEDFGIISRIRNKTEDGIFFEINLNVLI